MTRPRTVLGRALGALSTFFVACLAACSGGGSGTGNAQPAPLGAFAGSWDVTTTVTASNEPGTPVGEQELATVTIAVAGTQATLQNEAGDLTGTIAGNRVVLNRPGLSLTLDIGSDDRLTGTGTATESGGGVTTTVTFSLVAVRTPAGGGGGGGGGGGNALALATGTWTFSVDLNGSLLFFDDGQLTQNGASVTFNYSDSGITSVWTGNLTGAAWTPAVSGTLTFAIDGTFATDGRSFSGTFTSTLLGNGTITGAIVP